MIACAHYDTTNIIIRVQGYSNSLHRDVPVARHALTTCIHPYPLRSKGCIYKPIFISFSLVVRYNYVQMIEYANVTRFYQIILPTPVNIDFSTTAQLPYYNIDNLEENLI